MRIAADLEGTIADVHTLWIQQYNARHGTKYTFSDIDSWDFFKKGHTKFKMTREEFFNDFKELWCSSWKLIPPTEENIGKTLQSLHQKCKMDIVTQAVAAHSADGPQKIQAWLNKYVIPYGCLVILDLGERKIDLNYDFFVDDAPHMAKQAEECKKRLLLYDTPWNQNIEDSEYVTRINSLAEIPKLI